MHSARGTEPTREGADHQPKGEQQRLSTQIPLAGTAACYQQSPRKGQCLRSLAILEWQKTLLNSLLIFGCCHQNFSFYFSSFYYLPPLQFGIKFFITQRNTGPQWAEDAPTQILVPLFFQPQNKEKFLLWLLEPKAFLPFLHLGYPRRAPHLSDGVPNRMQQR